MNRMSGRPARASGIKRGNARLFTGFYVDARAVRPCVGDGLCVLDYGSCTSPPLGEEVGWGPFLYRPDISSLHGLHNEVGDVAGLEFLEEALAVGFNGVFGDEQALCYLL